MLTLHYLLRHSLISWLELVYYPIVRLLTMQLQEPRSPVSEGLKNLPTYLQVGRHSRRMTITQAMAAEAFDISGEAVFKDERPPLMASPLNLLRHLWDVVATVIIIWSSCLVIECS